MYVSTLTRTDEAERLNSAPKSVDGFQLLLFDLLDVSDSSPLYAPLRYSLQGGQKVRAGLCLSVAEHFDVLPTESCKLAAAIEMLHAFSLIQDDLPCMDDDSERRGRLSLHKAFGESTALLAANCLFARAFGLLSALQVPSLSRTRLINILSYVSGANGMSLGQWYDLEAKTIKLESLIEYHRLKTGLLFGASLQMPAILGGANPKQQAMLKKLGEILGIIYQIHDDISDYGKLNKELNNICNIPSRKVHSTLEKYRCQAREYISDLGELGKVISGQPIVDRLMHL